MAISLDSLNPEQREAVTHGEGPLLVVAGPGSGKTRVITSRIAWLIERFGVSPWHIMAVTFTNKAAAEMRERVHSMTGAAGVHVSTFHSFGARFLRHEADRLGLRRDFSIYDQGDATSLVRSTLKELNISSDSLKPQQVLHRISALKSAGIAPLAATEQAIGYQEVQIAQVYEKYQEVLKTNGAFDFDDLLLQPVHALREHEELRKEWERKIQWLLIDEYQDTNGVQYELALLLASGHRNLCVTGDPDQSIYSWRGANIGNILSFTEDFPEARQILLGQNYRSTRNIVAAADALVARNQQRIERRLTTENDDGPLIRVIQTPTQESEAWQVASLLRDWEEQEGIEPNQMAVFYRTNAQSRGIENALRMRDVPYVVVGGVEFYRRREIQDLLAWLRLLVNPWDEVAFGRAIAAPKRGIGDTSIGHVVSAARQLGLDFIQAAGHPGVSSLLRGKAKGALSGFRTILRDLSQMPASPVEPIMAALLAATQFESWLMGEDPQRGSERVENVRELLTDARDFDDDEQRAPGGLPAYLERLSLISDTDKWDPHRRAVSLMTLHSAKGLEFDAVVVTGVEDGLIPHSRALMEHDPAEMEEERRLLYVGITRARRHLALTLARNRMAFGSVMRNAPSCFLREIPGELLSFEGESSGYGAEGGRAPTTPFDSDYDDSPAPRRSKYGEGDDSLWQGVDESPGLVMVPGGKGKDASSNPWDDDYADPPAPESGAFAPVGDDDAGESEVGIKRVLRPTLPTVRGFGTVPAAPPPDRSRPPSSPVGQSGATLSAGDRVMHAMFGVGTVLALSKSSSGLRAKIRFDGWGEKNLALEYARLEKVS